MSLFRSFKPLQTVALLFLFASISIPAVGQIAFPESREGVLEVKNFTEEKMLPGLNLLLREKGGIEIQGYCLGQDLVVFHFNGTTLTSAQELAVFLEDKGYIVYPKENMTASEVLQVCKSPYVKNHNHIK